MSYRIEQVMASGEGWQKYFETFSDDLGEYFYKFDSWKELHDILDQDVIDVRNVSTRGPELWAKVRQQSLKDWAEILL